MKMQPNIKLTIEFCFQKKISAVIFFWETCPVLWSLISAAAALFATDNTE